MAERVGFDAVQPSPKGEGAPLKPSLNAERDECRVMAERVGFEPTLTPDSLILSIFRPNQSYQIDGIRHYWNKTGTQLPRSLLASKYACRQSDALSPA
jgi:hypothetical protein